MTTQIHVGMFVEMNSDKTSENARLFYALGSVSWLETLQKRLYKHMDAR